MIDIYDNSLFPYLLKSEFKEIINEMVQKGSEGECSKSKRVSAIVYPNGFSVIETNSPPSPFSCMNNDQCKKVCNQICIHAEERAILSTLRKYGDVDGCICIHLKIVNGQSIFSGNPSCITCARKLLECNIKYMYLWQEIGWKRWTSVEFFKDTLTNLKLT